MNIDEFVTKEQFDEFRNVENFDNNAILNKRWNKVDELLSTFYSKNQKINRKIYDNLQSIFDWIKFSYEEINDYANNNEIVRFRNRIEDIKDEYGLKGYIGYQLNNYSRRKKLKNKDILLGYIMVEYYRQYQEQNKQETLLFDEIKNVEYREVYKETIKIIKKKRIKKEIPEMPKSSWIDLLTLATYMGFSWLDYKEGNLGYNSRKLYELVIIHLQQGKGFNVYDGDIGKLLRKQQRAYLNKTIEEEMAKGYKDIYSGSLDNQISYLVNQIALQAMKDAGCTQVRFVAVLDENTTKMCKSLDGQIFDIYGMNIYARYSDDDKAEAEYKTLGLEVGANLPPINNHYHFCRSTIHPYK